MRNLHILLINIGLKSSYMLVSVSGYKLFIRLWQVRERGTEVSADQPAARLFICIVHWWTLECQLLHKALQCHAIPSISFDGKQ